MIKIGITGSIASGKTTASNFLAKGRGPLFCADKVIVKIYKSRNFKNLIKKKFGINNNIKKSLKKLIFKDKNNLKKLEKIVHPLAREKMKQFTSRYKNKKMLFYEIPLLVESKLMKFFNVIIFIKSKKTLRLQRFISRHGDKKLFKLLDNKQMSQHKKIKYCDHVVVNEKNLKTLKNRLSIVISKYE